MTDRHANDPKFDFYRTPERLARKWISVSRVDVVLNCPWAYHAQYELGLERPPPSKAIVMGRLFDLMCEGVHSDKNIGKLFMTMGDLTDDECELIHERYKTYEPSIPKPNTTQHPIELDLDYKGYWLMGFLDILPDDEGEPIIEVKFSQRPWSESKYKRKKFQATCYAEAMDRRPVRFDVSNYETDELQQWLVEPTKRAWTYARKRIIKAIDIIEGKACIKCGGKGSMYGERENCTICGEPIFTRFNRTPTPGILCKGQRLDDDGEVLYDWQCDYYGVCPEQIKQREVREIAEHL